MDKSFRERYAPILVTARLNSWDIIKVIVLIVMLLQLFSFRSCGIFLIALHMSLLIFGHLAPKRLNYN